MEALELKVSKEKKDFVKRVVKKWKSKLLLREWNIEFDFEEKDVCENVLARCSPCPIYLTSTISFGEKFWKLSKKKQEFVLVHELSHCLTEEFYEACHDLKSERLVTEQNIQAIRERLTQRITNIAFTEGIE